MDSPGRTILVADDEPAVLRLVTAILEARGHRVISAEHGDAALRAYDRIGGPIDLLLTDIRMEPHMGGPELARNLRLRQPGVKVLYISGHLPSHETVVREVMTNQAHFLPKPFTPAVLARMAEEAIASMPDPTPAAA